LPRLPLQSSIIAISRLARRELLSVLRKRGRERAAIDWIIPGIEKDLERFLILAESFPHDTMQVVFTNTDEREIGGIDETSLWRLIPRSNFPAMEIREKTKPRSRFIGKLDR